MSTRSSKSSRAVRLRAAAVVASVLGLVTGCVNLEGGKVGPPNVAECAPDGKAQTVVGGQRYYLPKPFVVYQLEGDGSLKASVAYMPDVTRQYAVQARSYAGKHTLNVERNADGTLKKVVFKPDASAVAAKAVEAGGNLAKTTIDKLAANKAAEAAEEKKAEEEAKKKAEEEKKKKEKAELAGLKADVDAARVNLDAADGALKALEGDVGKAKAAATDAESAAREAEAKVRLANPTDDQKADAVAKRAKADYLKEQHATLQARLDLSRPSVDAQRRAYDELKKQYDRQVAVAPTSNDPTATRNDPKPPTTRPVYGPMVYAVDEVRGAGVRLVPVKIIDRPFDANGNPTDPSRETLGQREYVATTLNIAAAPAKKGAFTIDPAPDADNVISLKEKGEFKITRVTGTYNKFVVKVFKGTAKKMEVEFDRLAENAVQVVKLSDDVTEGEYKVLIGVDEPSAANVDQLVFGLKVTH
ncbi:MAG: hypothetical protein ACAI43_22735 [Phycisphaerae bacterium]|nr:hypothetical protein [Tepidisphaeraceae bacterium]